MEMIFKKYLMPGFIFQSLIIGGGYGTGREIVEFFVQYGPVHGLYNMLIAAIIWSLVLAICFELCRIGKNYDYRSFLKSLMGKSWIAYEYLFLFGLVLVVSVMGSASGEIINEMFGVNSIFGISLMMILVSLIVYYGSGLIEKVFSVWSIILYIGFIFLFISTFIKFDHQIFSSFDFQDQSLSKINGGIKYAAYNIGLAPAIFFCAKYFNSRNEAMISGLMAGLIGMFPALLMFISMLSKYQDILSAPVPVNIILNNIGSPFFTFFFQLILFGTFIETGAGLIHGFNERIMNTNPNLSNNWRTILSLTILIASIFLAAKIGLINLIASGYGFITWGYWLVFVLPVLIIGSLRIMKN
ncbi:MAG: hypothetical protein CMG08_04780 [Candidatus Marinimicrobia bacterium]|nr:hypothetical protein [Candidatus Neomarinimicrobiota bacterium]